VSRTPAFRAAVALLLLCAMRAGAPAAEPPRRIASLSLTADEILVEIVPLERLVAATTAADDPEMSNVVGRVPPSIARFPKADVERLLALAPELVVVSEYTDADFLHLLERTRLRTHRMTGLHSLAGMRQAILDLGQAVGEPEAARRLVARFDGRLSDLAGRLAGAPRPRALYWSSPFTAGGDSAIGALIECGGAVNVGRELGLTGIQPLDAERAFMSQPDVIVVGLQDDIAVLRGHPLLSKLPAVRAGRLVYIPSRLLVTLSQHAADACWAIASALHPRRTPRGAP